MEPQELLTAAHLQAFVRHIDDRLDTLRTEMREGLAQIDTRLSHIETRLNHMDTRLDHMDGRFVQLDSRLGRLDDRGGRDDRPLRTSLLLAWLTAGVALAVSLFALLR